MAATKAKVINGRTYDDKLRALAVKMSVGLSDDELATLYRVIDNPADLFDLKEAIEDGKSALRRFGVSI